MNILPERFIKKFKKTKNCWYWIASTKNGYGQFKDIKNNIHTAHRFSYFIHNGSIPKGMEVLHKCDNTLCVNPKHLFLGTQADNLKDAIHKKRLLLKGEDNPMCRLKEIDINNIRNLYKLGYSVRILSNKFNCSKSNIYFILNGKRWKHIIN